MARARPLRRAGAAAANLPAGRWPAPQLPDCRFCGVLRSDPYDPRPARRPRV